MQGGVRSAQGARNILTCIIINDTNDMHCCIHPCLSPRLPSQVQGLGGARMEQMLQHFSRGYEACLVCEEGHCGQFGFEDVLAMADVVRRELQDEWRCNTVFSGKISASLLLPVACAL